MECFGKEYEILKKENAFDRIYMVFRTDMLNSR